MLHAYLKATLPQDFSKRVVGVWPVCGFEDQRYGNVLVWKLTILELVLCTDSAVFKTTPFSIKSDGCSIQYTQPTWPKLSNPILGALLLCLCPSLCLHLYFSMTEHVIAISTPLPLQNLCFSQMPLHIPRVLFLPASFFILQSSLSLSFSLSAPPTFLFSHCHLPLTLLLQSLSLLSRLNVFPFGFCHSVFIFHSLGCSLPSMLIMSLC